MARERNANAALSWPGRPAPATRGCRWRPRSGVGVRAGVAAADAEVEAVEVELPPFTVVVALPVIGQAVMAQYQAGAAAFGLQGDDDTGGPGPDGGVVCPAPGEHQAVRRVDLDELTGRLHAVPHQDAVTATGYRLQRGFGAHPLDIAAGVGEVREHGLGLGGDMHAHLDCPVIAHDWSLPRCSASARSLTRPRLRRQ